MAKVTLIIEDQGDEVTLMGTVDPAITPDKAIFSTAEIIGMYLQQNMSQIMGQAVRWAQTPDTVEEAQVKEPSLIVLPGAQL
jgi:hypothetical protein